MIPGVLVLNSNKTFGKIKNKFLYKFIPQNNVENILIVVPYTIKHVGFNKHFKNKYALIKIPAQSQKGQQIGTIIETIGDVDILENYYTYSLHCKKLHHSLRLFNKQMKLFSKSFVLPSLDFKTHNIISIDPPQSKDIDDAFSVTQLDDQTKMLSIYIANVSVLIDFVDSKHWDCFSDRVSTVYFPNKKIPMLPKLLSDYICSLLDNQKRIAFVCDIIVRDGKIIKTNVSNCIRIVEEM